jgi:2,5-diamino-6-(ribosylamino)-4(3H)-pyrimidinone 5'-phosphate reductase
MANRPVTTLFVLASVDGKISTGSSDKRDFDKDLPKIKGVREGLYQYYGLEKKTDLHSLNTGRVMAKIGINTRKDRPKKAPISFVLIDNKPHLTASGIAYLAAWLKDLCIVTTNRKHPAFRFKEENVRVFYYPKKIDLAKLLARLRKDCKIKRLTIQSGGTMNAAFLRESLIDRMSIVIAPALIGGKDTPTVADGESLRSAKDLRNIRALKLRRCRVLKNSYLHLLYDVIN